MIYATLVLTWMLTACASVPRSCAVPKMKLTSNHDIPVVGLGTWQNKLLQEVDSAINSALENGSGHIDTAYVYGNEEAIGKSLEKWLKNGGSRDELFITTKLPPTAMRPGDVGSALKISLEKLRLDYVDMFLIHVPMAMEPTSAEFDVDPDNIVLDLNSDLLTVWNEMEKQVKIGRARSIGISNFNETQLKKILDHAKMKPSNLQIEVQLYDQKRSLRKICSQNNITVTGYSPLGSPGTPDFLKRSSFSVLPNQLDDPTVRKIAIARNRTPAQVLLRHSVQGGIVVIPKSTHPHRIRENLQIFDFELSDDEMRQLDGLDQGDKGRCLDFGKMLKGSENHPEFPFTH